MERKSNILVVGTGFSGSVIARELADKGYNVTIIDRRSHIGGNCFDEMVNGVRVHKYGPHLFHTNNAKVVNWLSRFTEWVEYKHKVKAYYNGEFLTLPPNQHTQNVLGDRLFDVLYAPYTLKMWGTLEVDKKILDRVKVRDDDNELYFPNDFYQYLPKDGYTKVFENILNHPNITVQLNTVYNKNLESQYDRVFNSMAIDEYNDYCYGELPYRSIKFHHTDTIDFKMPTAVVNFTDNSKFTRVTNWSMLPSHGSGELYTLEEPCDYKENNLERYYPVKDVDNINKVGYNKYKSIHNNKVTFIGRCGLYTYLDMDMAIASSLSIANQFLNSNEGIL